MNNSQYIAEQNANWASRPVIETGIFHHDCIQQGCTNIVVFDDEPYCFTHSPDSGSTLRGYSARRAHQLTKQASDDMFDSAFECKWCNQFDCKCM